jgi:hypothetical protein
MCRKVQLETQLGIFFIINMELRVLQCEEPSLKLDHRFYQKFKILELKVEVLPKK